MKNPGYYQKQVLDILELGSQTLRHWRKVLPPLQDKRGQRACYTCGDILALKIVDTLCRQIRIAVGALEPVANALFAYCNSTPWMQLERSVMLIDALNGMVKLELNVDISDLKSAVVTLPLENIVKEVRQTLVADIDKNVQEELRFPPWNVSIG